MKTPYIKVIYRHLSASTPRILYVGNDGTETDVSDVIERVDIAMVAGDLARATIDISFVMVTTET
jgi:hypothetical protein